MSLNWSMGTAGSGDTAGNPVAYSAWKTVLAQTGFRGDVYVFDTNGLFNAWAVDYVRNYVNELSLNGEGTPGSQKPSTFDTDFPAAITLVTLTGHQINFTVSAV